MVRALLGRPADAEALRRVGAEVLALMLAAAAGHADVTQILAQYNTDYDAQAHVLAWGLRRYARRCRRKKLAVDAVAEAARNDELWPSRLTMERAAARRSRPSAEAEAP